MNDEMIRALNLEDEIRKELRDEPWLAFYYEEGDEDLDDARVRFAVAQRIAVRELREHDEPVEVRFVRRAMVTTSFASDREEVDG